MNDKARNEKIADLSLFFIAFIWASGFIVTKNILNLINPMYLIFLRFLLSTLLMSLIYFRRIKEEMSLESLKMGLVVGFLMFLGFTFQVTGLQYTTVSNQGFIIASNVVMVPFIIWIVTRYKPDNYEILAGFMAFLGLAIISYEPGMNLNLGDLLSLISALCFGCHIVALGVYARRCDPILLTTIQFGAVTIISLISMILFRIPKVDLNMEITKAVIFMTVVATVIPFGVQGMAQRYTSGTKAAIILSLESIFSLFLAVILLGEDFNLKIVLGASIVFLAVITAETKLKFIRKDRL